VTFLGPLMESKRLGLLHEMVPQAEVIAVLLDPKGPLADAQSQEVEKTARGLGLGLLVLRAGTEDDFDDAFTAMVRARAGALLIGAGPLFDARREPIIAQAARKMLPAMYARREFTEAGGLMSYGTTLADSFRQVGVYTAQILKGTKPAELPVLQTAKFEFLVNLKTAKALGLDVPPTLLARADEVIE
jgi:putative ABC transport system substrate-binding protein